MSVLYQLRRLRAYLNAPLRRYGYRRAVDRAISSHSRAILVYQMGKVASIAVAHSLRRVPGLNVFHIHLLDPDHITNVRNDWVRKGWEVPAGIDDLAAIFHEKVIQGGHPINIISLVREPIGRNISAYFENLDHIWKKRNAHNTVHVDLLIQGFFDTFIHKTPLLWFDEEFKKVLKLDVYEHQFPHDQGSLLINDDPYRVLIMKYDLDDHIKAELIRRFLSLDKFSIIPKNVSAKKRYGDLYRRVIGEIKIPASYIDQMLDSKYTRHFFSPEEIKGFRHRWLKNT